MNGTVLDALERLPSRLAGDEVHVAFVVLIDMLGQPTLWTADRGGRPHPVTAYVPREPGDEAKTGQAMFTRADLRLAATYLHEIGSAVTMRGCSLSQAHTRALESIERRRDWEMRRVMEAAADEAAHPHVCRCGRRFKTGRGLASHVARARYGQHGGES